MTDTVIDINNFCEKLKGYTYTNVKAYTTNVKAYKDKFSVRVNTVNGVHVDIISSDEDGNFKEYYINNDKIFSTESSTNNKDKRKLIECLLGNSDVLRSYAEQYPESSYVKIADALLWPQYRLRFIIEDNASGGKSRKQKKRKSRTMKRKSKK